MRWKKLIYIILLLFLLRYQNKKEGFTHMDLSQKSNEVLQKKYLFKPGTKYSNIKENIPWVDPVIYNDIYKLSLKEKLTISNLKSTLSNIIQ
jgi:hypothetical protein